MNPPPRRRPIEVIAVSNYPPPPPVRLSQSTRSAVPVRDWELVDRDCGMVLELFREPGAKSLVRLGDGEMRVLRNRQPEAIATGLAGAVASADCLGLPDSYRNPPRGVQKCAAALVTTLDRDYSTPVWDHPQIGSGLFDTVPELIGWLATGRRVLWITSGAGRIVSNLDHPAFRDYYGLHDIADNYQIDMPAAGSGGALAKAFPESVTPERAYADVQRQLAEAPDFDLAFIGFGIVGKLICHHIKTELGKTAIDAGCMMSALQGRRDRGYLRPGAAKDFLVWDPERE